VDATEKSIGEDRESAYALVDSIYQELEKLEAGQEKGSLMPLYYCLRAANELLKPAGLAIAAKERRGLVDVLPRIESSSPKRKTRDEGGQTKTKSTRSRLAWRSD
jgi:hypothetical protein